MFAGTLRGFRSGTLVLVAILTLVGPAAAQKLLAQDVAAAIAEYAAVNTNGVKGVLRALGVDTAQLPSDFDQVSQVQQLRWVYSVAEATEDGAGPGFIATFVRRVSVNTPSILSEPGVSQFLASTPAVEASFQLDLSRPLNPARAPDADVQRIIEVVVDVVSSRGSALSPMRIMERRLGLRPDEVLSALVEHGSARKALANYLAVMPNPPQREELARIALDIMKATPASRGDARLGEAVFRWLGLSHPGLGEWFRMRDRMLDLVPDGALSLSAEKQVDAKAVAAMMRRDFPRMTAEFLNRNLNLQPQDIERMYFEYIKRTESAAVLWSFTVISLKPDIDYAWDSSVKERGPKPFHGFVEYARSTGYADQASASQYARSSGFNKWVGKLCPVD